MNRTSFFAGAVAMLLAGQQAVAQPDKVPTVTTVVKPDGKGHIVTSQDGKVTQTLPVVGNVDATIQRVGLGIKRDAATAPYAVASLVMKPTGAGSSAAVGFVLVQGAKDADLQSKLKTAQDVNFGQSGIGVFTMGKYEFINVPVETKGGASVLADNSATRTELKHPTPAEAVTVMQPSPPELVTPKVPELVVPRVPSDNGPKY